MIVGGSAGKPVLLVLASTYPRWNGDPEPGFVHELCRRLAGRFDVIALVPDANRADPSGVMDGVDVVRYRYAPRRFQTLVHDGGIIANLRRSPWKWILLPSFIASQWWAAVRLLRSRQVALVHAHWLLPQGLVALAASRVLSVPYVVTSHGGDLFGLRGWLATTLKRRVVSAASAMTVVSPAMQREVERLQLGPRELRVIPMGVDLRQRFVPNEQIERSTAELLFVGRMVPKKGLHLLIDALPGIAARCPEVFLTIAGFGPDEERIRALVARHGLGERVRFLGATPQEQLPALYQRAALFVAPFLPDNSGDQEGAPVALMEAVACGCPAVVGDVPGIRDLVGDGASLVSPGNLGALTDAVVDALANPRRMRQQADALRRTLHARIDWDRISDAFADLLMLAAGIPLRESGNGP